MCYFSGESEKPPARPVAPQEARICKGGAEKSSGAQHCEAETPAGVFPKMGLEVIKNKKREKDRV